MFSVESPGLLFTKFFPMANELIYLLGELTVVIGNSAFERWVMDYYAKFSRAVLCTLLFLHIWLWSFSPNSKDVNIS